MDALFWTAFALGLAFCAPPGAVTAETLRRGIHRGFAGALFLELGSLVGDATWAARSSMPQAPHETSQYRGSFLN
jgi:chemosensory pili system protein ChpE